MAEVHARAREKCRFDSRFRYVDVETVGVSSTSLIIPDHQAKAVAAAINAATSVSPQNPNDNSRTAGKAVDHD